MSDRMDEGRKEEGERERGDGALEIGWGDEVVRVVRRLVLMVEDHERSAERLGVELDREMVCGVVGALRAELEGRDAAPWLADADEIRRHVATALYEELLDEPSNVFVATRVNPDTMRYEAMPVGIWARCVDGLERALLG